MTVLEVYILFMFLYTIKYICIYMSVYLDIIYYCNINECYSIMATNFYALIYLLQIAKSGK